MHTVNPLETIALSTQKASNGSIRNNQDTADPRIRHSAKEFEASFIAQMLTAAGLDKAFTESSGFGGEAFSSLLIEQYAQKLSDYGGFGLANEIYKQLREDAQ